MIYFGYPVVNSFRSKTPKGFYDSIKGHTGIDILCPTGTPLSLPIKTEVYMISKQKEMGLTLYLEDKHKNILVFSHLSNVKVKLGGSTNPVTTFALTGNSGTKSTAPHLHFEVIAERPQKGFEMMTRSLQGIEGYNIDPVKYLDSILTPHWSKGAMDWMLEHQIVTEGKDPNDSVTWGEYAVTQKRLAEKLIEWINPK